MNDSWETQYDYQKLAKYIIDKWLDDGYKLTDLIEAYIRSDQIACFESAAKIAEGENQHELARKLRTLKPRKFIFNQK